MRVPLILFAGEEHYCQQKSPSDVQELHPGNVVMARIEPISRFVRSKSFMYFGRDLPIASVVRNKRGVVRIKEKEINRAKQRIDALSPLDS